MLRLYFLATIAEWRGCCVGNMLEIGGRRGKRRSIWMSEGMACSRERVEADIAEPIRLDVKQYSTVMVQR